jgi:hypothetical protein
MQSIKNKLKKPVPLWSTLLTGGVLLLIFLPLTYYLWVNCPANQYTEFFPSTFKENQKIVFTDWWNVQAGYYIQDGKIITDESRVPKGVEIAYFRPNLTNPIIIADKPWESNLINVYSSLIYDGGKYRLYYEAYPNIGEQQDDNAILCLAESTDGLSWTKPNLNLVSYEGNTLNNIIFTPSMHPKKLGLHGCVVFLDPHSDASEKFKMTYASKDDFGDWVVYGATSADGLSWALIKEPLVKEYADSQTIIAWDEYKQKYVGYFRHWEQNRRHISYAESSDFKKWPQPTLLMGAESFLEPDTDYYTNSYTRWPDAPGAYLMFPTLYHRGNNTLPGDHNDVTFAVSRSGLDWSFPFNEPYLGVGTIGSGYEGKIFVGAGVVELSNGLWALPVGCSPLTHNMPYPAGGYLNDIRLATIRQDGFSAIVAKEYGNFWINPSKIADNTLKINAVTGSSGYIKIELINPETNSPFGSFSFQNCGSLNGDSLWETLQWNGASDLSELIGKTVEIHIEMFDAKIYALKFINQ